MVACLSLAVSLTAHPYPSCPACHPLCPCLLMCGLGSDVLAGKVSRAHARRPCCGKQHWQVTYYQRAWKPGISEHSLQNNISEHFNTMLRNAHCCYSNTPGFPQALFSSLLRALMLSQGADFCPGFFGSVWRKWALLRTALCIWHLYQLTYAFLFL